MNLEKIAVHTCIPHKLHVCMIFGRIFNLSILKKKVTAAANTENGQPINEKLTALETPNLIHKLPFR